MPDVHVAHSDRGTCAGCDKPVKAGQRYSNATRYPTVKEREGGIKMISGGRVPIVLHEGCPHPGSTKRQAEQRENDLASVSTLCRGGQVPGPGGLRTCPACGGKGC